MSNCRFINLGEINSIYVKTDGREQAINGLFITELGPQGIKHSGALPSRTTAQTTSLTKGSSDAEHFQVIFGPSPIMSTDLFGKKFMVLGEQKDGRQ